MAHTLISSRTSSPQTSCSSAASLHRGRRRVLRESSTRRNPPLPGSGVATPGPAAAVAGARPNARRLPPPSLPPLRPPPPSPRPAPPPPGRPSGRAGTRPPGARYHPPTTCRRPRSPRRPGSHRQRRGIRRLPAAAPPAAAASPAALGAREASRWSPPPRAGAAQACRLRPCRGRAPRPLARPPRASPRSGPAPRPAGRRGAARLCAAIGSRLALGARQSL
mmetsp:Transcript_5020/g.16067  ORF Transcript_5020/g.16067 Transcript_5020/m.16067 type:complete len:221 (+) Transcript_5020:36-698(+)